MKDFQAVHKELCVASVKPQQTLAPQTPRFELKINSRCGTCLALVRCESQQHRLSGQEKI